MANKIFSDILHTVRKSKSPKLRYSDCFCRTFLFSKLGENGTECTIFFVYFLKLTFHYFLIEIIIWKLSYNFRRKCQGNVSFQSYQQGKICSMKFNNRVWSTLLFVIHRIERFFLLALSSEVVNGLFHFFVWRFFYWDFLLI